MGLYMPDFGKTGQERQFGLMDDKGILTAMPDTLLEKPVKKLCSPVQCRYLYGDSSKDQRKKEIVSMIGETSNRRGIDMIYGFVRRLYREEQDNGKKRQGQYCNGNSE